MNEISNKIDEDTSVCATYMKNLITLGIVKKESPYAVNFTDIGRWWGTNPQTRSQEEIVTTVSLLRHAFTLLTFCFRSV